MRRVRKERDELFPSVKQGKTITAVSDTLHPNIRLQSDRASKAASVALRRGKKRHPRHVKAAAKKSKETKIKRAKPKSRDPPVVENLPSVLSKSAIGSRAKDSSVRYVSSAVASPLLATSTSTTKSHGNVPSTTVSTRASAGVGPSSVLSTTRSKILSSSLKKTKSSSTHSPSSTSPLASPSTTFSLNSTEAATALESTTNFDSLADVQSEAGTGGKSFEDLTDV
eukprot:GHVT01096705.1.p2 GENE.GHVT01096705.1~~GHVT01096705.1.p2  ORF type:complete len:225 (+),score=29.35 GHVT01096705.1:477-1151(+)